MIANVSAKSLSILSVQHRQKAESEEYIMTLKDFFHELNATCTIWRKIYISIILSAFVLVVDELDWPTTIFSKFPWIWIVIVALGLCILFIAIDKGIFNLFKLLSINTLDQACIISMISSLMCLCYFHFGAVASLYKIIVCISVFLISMLIFVIRTVFIISKRKKALISNTLDLKELCSGNKKFDPESPLLIEDNDNIDYDLLNHEYLVQGLYQAIIHCHTEESFTFGLEGPWGSGKTTIINKIKKLILNDKSNGLILIDDFDPWLCGNQESMLITLYDLILNRMHIRMGKLQSQRMLKTLTSTIGNISNTGKILDSILLSPQNEESNIHAIRNELKKLLKHSAYRFVIFIDNLDRADADNVLFVFKLVATFFDLPNIIYVLSYDKERVYTILKEHKHLDPGYLEKIIQSSCQVPMFLYPQRERIVKSCVLNVLSGIGVPENETSEYTSIIDYIAKRIDNIRSLKRLLNSIFTNALIQNTPLSKADLFAIETIRFFDYELYQYIYNHRQLFITYDRHLDSESWIATINTDEFNRKANETFNLLFKEKPDSLSILSYLFPTVHNYKSKATILSRYTSDESYKRYIGKMAICSAKYFDLYFSNSLNTHAISGIHVQSTIRSINNAKPADVSFVILQAIQQIPDTYQKEWFEQFELHLADIIPEKHHPVAMALIHNWKTFANYYVAFALSARDRAAVILLRIITQYNDLQFSSILETLNENYCNFLLIRRLISFYRDDEPTWQKELLKEQAYKMGQEVITQKINLFDDEYYLRGNMLAFALLQKEKGTESSSLAVYLETTVTSRSIYRFLLEMLATGSMSSSIKMPVYLYYIHPEREKLFSINPEKIEQCLNDNPINNDSKAFLVDVYKKYIESPPTQDGHHENSIESDEELFFSDI